MSDFFEELRRGFGQHVPGPTRHYRDFSEEEKAKYRATSPSGAETKMGLRQFPEVVAAPKLGAGEQLARTRAVPIEYDEYVTGDDGKERKITKTGYVAVDEEDLAKNDFLQGLIHGRVGSDTGKIGIHGLVLDEGIKEDGGHAYGSIGGRDAIEAINALRGKNLRVATQKARFDDSASDYAKKLYYDRSYPYLYESNDYDRYSYLGGKSNGNWRSIPGAVDEFINRYRNLQ